MDAPSPTLSELSHNDEDDSPGGQRVATSAGARKSRAQDKEQGQQRSFSSHAKTASQGQRQGNEHGQSALPSEPECFYAGGEDSTPSPVRWRRGPVLGEGTFGKVYKGLNERTGELLAVKQLCIVDGTDEDVKQLRREISVMWALDHPNIVRYLGTAQSERFLFIVLEYVSGGSIAHMLKQFGPFAEKLIRFVPLSLSPSLSFSAFAPCPFLLFSMSDLLPLTLSLSFPPSPPTAAGASLRISCLGSSTCTPSK